MTAHVILFWNNFHFSNIFKSFTRRGRCRQRISTSPCASPSTATTTPNPPRTNAATQITLPKNEPELVGPDRHFGNRRRGFGRDQEARRSQGRRVRGRLGHRRVVVPSPAASRTVSNRDRNERRKSDLHRKSGSQQLVRGGTVPGASERWRKRRRRWRSFALGRC